MHVGDNAIKVNELRRRYGPAGAQGFDAVRGVSFEVARGELFALLGTNGAGKTSTVELLEGLAAPTGGAVRVLGHDPCRERALVRPRIGVMLQEGGFPSELTAAETVRMWAGCTSGARPVDEALELVGLARRRAVRVKMLSGGERRRLDLALALLGHPEVLFLDEPTTGLDAEGRRDTWELVRTLRDQGTTVLLTTHYLEEAEALADRLAIMHRGRIATSGRVAEIVAERPSRLTLTLPTDVHPTDLPPVELLAADAMELPAMPDATGGTTVRLSTRDLQRTATEVLLWARDRDIPLTGLDARSASLEEAFLHIARGLDDEDGEMTEERTMEGAAR
ncbi:ABC transporter ATP-binding protein [Streptomyces cucumeris]|uniref:ABC transporter ATP-binding protein n=1 Tax=Streptomyces cucumeris TaxID=2962890 RepID=UPI003D70E2D2